MDQRTRTRSVAVSAVILVATGTMAASAPPAPGAVDFARDITPILDRACLSCHQPPKVKGGLTLTSREAVLRGGASGPAAVPGDAARSLLFTRLTETPDDPIMPPPPGTLSDAERLTLRAWIDQGLVWPAAGAAAPASTTATTAVSAPADHAFAPVHDLFLSRCVRCHGPDRQEKGLRLDTRAGTLRGGEAGPVVQPGKSNDSVLLKRLLGQVEPRMPYQEAPLDPGQIALVRSWIDAGAPGPDEAAERSSNRHWAYVKPLRPEPPAVKRKGWPKNPIDAFVLARLEEEEITPSPPAAKETLLRRVTLDLIGLPPAPAEIDAFLADESADAYEKVVDRLLASPHYGERWARPWLDLARYADTHGYEKDNRRTAWKWRDWVIAAFNADMPFRQFTIEQMAGDMLPDPTAEQRIATGFHRNTLLNQEGGIDVEEARWETLVDRVNTTATVWLGSTLACAQCHDHKFDPFSQKDYYRMLAFFDNGEYKALGQGPRVMDAWIVEPELELPTPEQAARKKTLEEEIARVQARLEATTPALTGAQARWEQERAAARPRWNALRPTRAIAAAGAVLEVSPEGTVTAGGPNADRETYTVVARLPAAPTTGVRLEVLADAPHGSPGRGDYGAFVLTGVALGTAAAGGGTHLVPVARAESDEGNVAGALDDDPTTGWGSFDPSRSQTAVFQPRKPLARGATLTITLAHQGSKPKHNLRQFRLSVTSAANPWGGLALPERLRLPPAPGRPEDPEAKRKALTDYYRSIAPALEADRSRLRALRKDVNALAIPTAMVLRERAGGGRPSTPLRVRGSYLAPGERVYAGVPAALPPLPERAMPNRLGLALWLTDEANPLTARVTMNRVWEQYFGRGLVETSEDFGTQGERPTHPGLLDWLATEFQRQETRLKPLHRLIVTSATYRQSSRFTPLLRESDPYNRLLARGPRFRVEAETVRDIALVASGLLSGKVGGPSVFPFQPEGIWDNPYSEDRWDESKGEDRHRRALYTFVRRTAPYPSLTVFDAPSREFCTARRVRTNTPLQALTTLNDPVFVEAARALAARAIKEAGPGAEARASRAFRLCTGRRPGPEELAPLLAFYAQQHSRFEADGAAAQALLGAATDTASASEHAAWTLVANVLLSLDETVTKE